MRDTDWIGFDFDRTLATYTHWTGPAELGQPIWPMINRLKWYLSQGYKVRIFTARISNLTEQELDDCLRAMNAWITDYVGQSLPITDRKDMHCIRIYDDIARQVIPNTGKVVGEDDNE